MTVTPRPGRRAGFTLIELLVVIAIIGVLVALLLPAVQQAREAARRVQCQNNLRQFGIALHNYHDAHSCFPPGFILRIPSTFAGANTLLLPYIEQGNLQSLYDMNQSWEFQSPVVAKTVIPMFICPSNSGPNPVDSVALRNLASVAGPLPIGTTLAITTYLYCKGATDAWCFVPHDRSRDGMFDNDELCRMRDLLDGSSQTFAIGEGATGSNWPVCHGPGCSVPALQANGTPWLAEQPWLIAVVNSTGFVQSGLMVLPSAFGCTVERLNKTPVTDGAADTGRVGDCRPSYENGPHSTSNFRSSHAGGGYFLLADGSVRMIGENIDLQTYRKLSTIAGGEVIGEF